MKTKNTYNVGTSITDTFENSCGGTFTKSHEKISIFEW